MCTAFIYRHIFDLAPDQIFTTRHMLIYGSRAAVDSALCRMVGSGFIKRLARGVFIREFSRKLSMMEIVQAKVKAFGGKAVGHVKDLLAKVGLVQSEESHCFAKNGSSSSFWTVEGRAVLKNHCGRKMKLTESSAGNTALALWYARGADNNLEALTIDFSRTDRELFSLTASLIPAWLNDEMYHPGIYRRVTTENSLLC